MSYTLFKVVDGLEEHKITAPKSMLFLDKTNARPAVDDILIVFGRFPPGRSQLYTTSLIEEILEDSPRRVKFEALDGVYIWEDNSEGSFNK